MEVLDPKELVGLEWYDGLYKCITNIRTIVLKRTVSEASLIHYLQKHPELHIQTILSHTVIPRPDGSIPKKEDQRIQFDKEDYIDEFGFYVYSARRISNEPDVDYRYDIECEKELFTLKYIEK